MFLGGVRNIRGPGRRNRSVTLPSPPQLLRRVPLRCPPWKRLPERSLRDFSRHRAGSVSPAAPLALRAVRMRRVRAPAEPPPGKARGFRP